MAEHPTPEHPGDAASEPHDGGDHADDGGHGDAHGHDDHGHGSEALGPIDIERWGAFVVGIGLGLVVALCVAVATGGGPA